MAVLSVSEQVEASGGWNNTWQRTYQRMFRVECDSNHDTEYTIRNATKTIMVAGVPTVVPWLPVIGSPFGLYGSTIDAGAFVQSHAYRRVAGNLATAGGKSTWEVEIQWGPYDCSIFGSDPTEWPLRASFGAQKFERIMLQDVNNVPILNSAKRRFEDPVTADDSRDLITFVRNERIKAVPGSGGSAGLPGFDFTLAATYRDTVNAATWNGFAAKTVKCASITTGEAQYDSNNQIYFFEVTYSFEINLNTWQKVILDQGFDKVVLGQTIPIIVNGQQVDDPVLLDGSGGVLASGGTPVYLTFDIYESKDFSVFNIDFSALVGNS